LNSGIAISGSMSGVRIQPGFTTLRSLALPEDQ
jgi:hypothetical protein